ncbi:Arm DNA-binding domain-containing protein [[Clostridium] innocuum]
MKWDIQIRYKDAFGGYKKTTRRGFESKKEAE